MVILKTSKVGVNDTPTLVNININFYIKIMSTKKAKKEVKKRGLIPSMIQKSEKSKNYVYHLTNGTTLEFENKEFPAISNTNQLTLF